MGGSKPHYMMQVAGAAGLYFINEVVMVDSERQIDKEQVKADYIAGMKYQELADKYGVTINTIKSWKQRYGWDRKSMHTKSKSVHTKKDAYISIAECAPDEPLTEKEQLFCEIYVKNFNASQAARQAGYSIDNARYIGYELLTKPHIRAYIAKLKEIKKAALLLSEDDIVERYMRIAFADMTDFVEFGRTLVPVMTAFGPMIAVNPASGEKEIVMKPVNEVRFKESHEVDGGLICQIKQGKDGASIKLEDRQKALDWLANYFNMNPMDRHKQDYDNKRLQLQERLVKVQEEKTQGDSSEGLISQLIEGLKQDG